MIRPDKFKPRGVEFHLFDGDGCYVPYKWPHWVRTANEYSISMAITWRSKAVHRDIDLQFCNSMLRSLGFPQVAPGKNPALDSVKLALYRAGLSVIRPLRSSQSLPAPTTRPRPRLAPLACRARHSTATSFS